MGRKYDAAYLEKLRQLLAAPKEQGYEWLGCQPDEVVVDVGCGLGHDAAKLARTGAIVWGLDINDALLAQARSEYGHTVRFENQSAQAMGFGNGTVDKMRLDRVLQHISDHDPVLAEAQRVLKPGGILQITDTDYQSMSYFFPDGGVERKLTDAVTRRFKGSLALRVLPEKLKQFGFGAVRLALHQLLVYGFESADYLISMDEIIREDASMMALSESELGMWRNWRESGPCLLAVNLFVMQAAKEN